MIEGSYTLSIDDLTEAGKAALGKEFSGTRGRVVLVAIGMGLIAIVVTHRPSPLYWLIPLGLFFIWAAISHPGQTVRKHFQKSVTNEEVTAQISEAGIMMTSATSRTEMKWAGFRSFVETPRTISLITISNGMCIFPKRAFNEQSCQQFRELIQQEKVPPSHP